MTLGKTGYRVILFIFIRDFKDCERPHEENNFFFSKDSLWKVVFLILENYFQTFPTPTHGKL